MAEENEPNEQHDNGKRTLTMITGTPTPPTPYMAYRKDSIGADTGLTNAIQANFPGIWDMGYTIGVPYIHKVIPKVTSCRKSRYLVVKADTTIPNPIPSAASWASIRGSAISHHVGLTVAPVAQ